MEPTMEAGMEPGGGMKAVPGRVVQIDEGRIQAHLDEVVRATVEETLNGLLDAEADRLCGARKYERTEGRKDTRAGSYDRQLAHQGRRGDADGAEAAQPALRDSDHRALSPERVIGGGGSDRDVPGRGERAAGGRHHAGTVGHAGQRRQSAI